MVRFLIEFHSGSALSAARSIASHEDFTSCLEEFFDPRGSNDDSRIPGSVVHPVNAPSQGMECSATDVP